MSSFTSASENSNDCASVLHRDELDTLQAGVDHAVHRVAATAADADDLDDCEVVLRTAEHRVTFPTACVSTAVGVLRTAERDWNTACGPAGRSTVLLAKPSTSTSG